MPKLELLPLHACIMVADTALVPAQGMWQGQELPLWHAPLLPHDLLPPPSLALGAMLPPLLPLLWARQSGSMGYIFNTSDLSKKENLTLLAHMHGIYSPFSIDRIPLNARYYVTFSNIAACPWLRDLDTPPRSDTPLSIMTLTKKLASRVQIIDRVLSCCNRCSHNLL